MALSNSVRDSCTPKFLIKKVVDNLGMNSERLDFLSISTVFDSKNSAKIMATSPRMTPTSKQIAVKYHWFW